MHLVGRFSFRLGRLTTAHNFVFGLLVENVGGSLPPIAMVPSVELVTWIQLERQVNPTEADLKGLEAEPEDLITVSEEAGRAGVRTAVEVQKLVMVTKVWATYIPEPKFSWEAFNAFKI